MKFVLSYESPAEMDMEKVRAHFEAHRARWQVFQEQGTLLLIGPFADPRDGAMAVFTTQEAGRRVRGNRPFRPYGVVAAWTIKGWNEVLL